VLIPIDLITQELILNPLDIRCKSDSLFTPIEPTNKSTSPPPQNNIHNNINVVVGIVPQNTNKITDNKSGILGAIDTFADWYSFNVLFAVHVMLANANCPDFNT
jgi:hypothetical protein